MSTDGLKKQRRKLHGAATKKGIKNAKARKVVVKKATLALRKSKKQEIVERLFTPKSLWAPKGSLPLSVGGGSPPPAAP